MRAERELRGLVLDLRHNPGGLLKSAVDFSNAFVERGRIVAGQDRNGRRGLADELGSAAAPR
jgi:carboxyl-terminal processing protease